MAKLVFCGQAPSRIGDGRPFSGPSGRRLAKLCDLEDYEALARQVILTNIFNTPAVKRDTPLRPNRSAPGDHFDKVAARAQGIMKMAEWARDPELVVVIACGKQVHRALIGVEGEFFRGKAFVMGPARGVDVWCFPHPSGVSTFWNDPQNVRIAGRFLKALLKRYGIAITK